MASPATAERTDALRVLVVDDHAVVRTGLRLLLNREEQIEVVGEAGNGEEALLGAQALEPDIVLLDLVMPDMNGIEVARELHEQLPQIKVLILSIEDDPTYVREAFAVGAAGYVLKEAADTELIAAVCEVARGSRYVHPELGARLVVAEAKALAAAAADPLSEREREVLRLLALGHTNQEIAQMLQISVRTAETHRGHIMTKLRISTRAELVRYALGHGLLTGQTQSRGNPGGDGRGCAAPRRTGAGSPARAASTPAPAGRGRPRTPPGAGLGWAETD